LFKSDPLANWIRSHNPKGNNAISNSIYINATCRGGL
jgi:hypothetical protein